MPHEDGGAYHPVVATVSLGGSVVLDVTEKPRTDAEENGGDQKSWRILQEPRSLLVTTGSAYTETLHGIANVFMDEDLNEQSVANWSLLGDSATIAANAGKNERLIRISLTFRDVKKVSNVGSRIFGRGKG